MARVHLVVLLEGALRFVLELLHLAGTGLASLVVLAAELLQRAQARLHAKSRDYVEQPFAEPTIDRAATEGDAVSFSRLIVTDAQVGPCVPLRPQYRTCIRRPHRPHRRTPTRRPCPSRTALAAGSL